MTVEEIALGDYQIRLDTDNGQIIGLKLDDGPNVIRRIEHTLNVGVSLGWEPFEAAPIYVNHAALENKLLVTLTLGPLKLTDSYEIQNGFIARHIAIENASSEELQLTGLRMALSGTAVGEPDACQFNAPGNVVRPRVPLSEAAAQPGEAGRYSEHFAPGAHHRWGNAFGDAPDVGPGLMVVHNPQLKWSLLTWYVSDVQAAKPFVTGNGNRSTLGFDVTLAGWLKPDERLIGGTQYIMLQKGKYQEALTAYRDTFKQTGITPPIYGEPDNALDWNALYEVHPGQFGGFDGLRAEIPRLAEMGIDTLYLMPIQAHRNKTGQPWDGNWEAIGSPYAIHDFEQIEPSLGTEEDFRLLVDTAHAHGLRVLIDLVLQGSSLEARYVEEHPEWYARDEQGEMVHSHGWNDTWSFDWANPDYQAYMLKWTTEWVEKFDIDGYRVDAPHGKEPNWDRDLPYHASQTNLGAVSLLEELRRRLLAIKPDAALYCELFGPLFTRSHDISNDYHPHAMVYQLFEDGGRLTPHEFNEYLRDYWVVMPPDSPRICFTETHDTREWPAYGLRGSDIARTMLGILTVAGFVPMIWSGQEEGQREFLQGLLGARQDCRTLRRGKHLFNAVSVDDMNHYRRGWGDAPADRVYTHIRYDAKNVLLGLASLTPERVTYQFGLPLNDLPLSAEKTYRLRDLISGEVWNEYGRKSWDGEDLRGVRLTPRMYTPYILAIEEMSTG